MIQIEVDDRPVLDALGHLLDAVNNPTPETTVSVLTFQRYEAIASDLAMQHLS